MDIKCPYANFKKTCEEIRTKCVCPKWVKIVGQDPQSKKQFDDYACSDQWVPVLLVENGRQMYSLGGAIESMRNEMVKLQGEANSQFNHFLKFVKEIGEKRVIENEIETRVQKSLQEGKQIGA